MKTCLRFAVLLAFLSLCNQAYGEGQDGIRRPVRITAGPANQFMGVLGENDEVYYVSDEAQTTEIFVQNLYSGGPRLVLDLDADVTWPRVSPDGRRLLFISYRDNAQGRVCILDLRGFRETVRDKGALRCPTDGRGADLQAFWFPDGKAIGVVQRKEMGSDVRLVRFPAEGGKGEVVIDKNLSSPAISPDGRFIAYVPLERADSSVGVTFAMRPARGLEIRRLDDGSTIEFTPDLPGVTGFPVFSPDGHFLYFVQYLNDTNLDGVIDGNDHGVIFRVPFNPDGKDPFEGARSEQLTSARWNCQYPAPAKDKLLMTCAFSGSLDVYWLPLEGSIPSTWDTERLASEIEASRDHWERLMLIAKAVARENEKERRIEWLRHLVHMHLEVREFEAASFYTRLVAKEAPQSSLASEWAKVVQELIGHREAESRLVQGQLSERFVQGERRRLERLRSMTFGNEDAKVLADLVMSEILDVLGDEEKGDFRCNLKGVRDWYTVFAAVRRAWERANITDDFGPLLEASMEASENEGLSVSDRLFFADLYVRTLLRGKGQKERMEAVEEALKGVDKGSILYHRLELERWLQGLGERDPEEIRAGLFEIYRKTKDLERRKNLVLTTARQAAQKDEEYIMYEFANSWVSWLKRKEPERRYAEELYRLVVLERAYAKWAKGEYSDARGLFYGVTLQTDSLEAHIGTVEARMKEGKGDVLASYRERYANQPDHPILAFVQAYLIARGLSEVEKTEEFMKRADEALTLVRKAAMAFPNAFEVHHLWGFIEHLKYLRSGASESAAAANTHYLLALDLAKDNPRALAATYEALGLLHAALGNHGGAVAHFRARADLPFLDRESEVALKIAWAQSLLHVGRKEEALQRSEEALAIAEADQGLRDYLVVAIDRAALCNLEASKAERAEVLYKRLLEGKWGGEEETQWNRIRWALGLAASALGAHHLDVALSAAEEALGQLEKASELPAYFYDPASSLPRPRVYFKDDFVAMALGLKAKALRELGRIKEAQGAEVRRREVIRARLKKYDLDEDRIALAFVQYHLAEYAAALGDKEGAMKEVEEGLRLVREFEERTGTKVTLAALWLYRAYGELRVAKVLGKFDKELKEVFDFMCRFPNPQWAFDRFLLGTYLAILEVQEGSEGRK